MVPLRDCYQRQPQSDKANNPVSISDYLWAIIDLDVACLISLRR